MIKKFLLGWIYQMIPLFAHGFQHYIKILFLRRKDMRYYTLIYKVVLSTAVAAIPFQSVISQSNSYASCDSYLPALRQIENNQQVGPASCSMQEIEVVFNNRDFIRVDMGLDGSVEGYVTKEGKYREYLTNTPELVFPQTQYPDVQQPYLAVAKYEMAKGAAITLIYPKVQSDWNGKLWVAAHGRGRSFSNGSLKIWHDYLDREEPILFFDKLQKHMLAQGYAVAVTMRTSAENEGDIITTLSDGTVVDWVAFNDSHSLIKDYTAIAESVLTARLGSAPSRTYLYGKSAGARLARGMNYFGQRLNTRSDGRPFFDGFLVDDSAAGTWIPVVMEDGKDTLLLTDAEKQAFVPQLELVHQMYFSMNNHGLPNFVTLSFLTNKYNNARFLLDKGLGDKFRMYEIQQISHNGGESYPDGRSSGKAQVLDLSLIVDKSIGILDNWVEGVTVPPPSMSDYAVVGDANKDGIIENPAIQYPEVACPLGTFYPYPTISSGTTSWVAFTGVGIEPLDGNNVFIDMNNNGLWDFRETPTQAWQRLGLLAHGEELTQAHFVSCVQQAAEKLHHLGFFSEETVKGYIENAKKHNIKPVSDDDNALIYYSRI